MNKDIKELDAIYTQYKKKVDFLANSITNSKDKKLVVDTETSLSVVHDMLCSMLTTIINKQNNE